MWIFPNQSLVLGKSIKEVKQGFQAAIDDYLEWCKRHAKEPEKPSTKVKDSASNNSKIFANKEEMKELTFDEPKLGRIDTSCVMHRFDLCIKYVISHMLIR